MTKLVGTKAVINTVKPVLIFSLIVFPVVTANSCKSVEVVASSGNKITGEVSGLGSVDLSGEVDKQTLTTTLMFAIREIPM